MYFSISRATTLAEKMTNKAANRIATYVAVSVVLSVGFLAFFWQPWVGDTQSHTLMETSASIIAFMVGLISIVRFHAANNRIFLYVGVGFIGAAFLDGYHFVVTSTFLDGNFPSAPSSLIPWSWIASRVYLSTLLSVGLIAYRPNSAVDEPAQISVGQVYGIAGLLTLSCFAFFAFVPLPRAYYPELPLHRPEELVPAVLFGIALIGILKRRFWEEDQFEHWLAISVLMSIVIQTIFISTSERLFDTQFQAAHMLKIISYVAVLTGLILDIFHVFRQSDNRERELVRSVEQQNRLASENSALAEIGRIVGSTLDIKSAFDKFAEQVGELIPFDRVSVTEIEWDTSTVRAAYVALPDILGQRVGDILPLSETISGGAAKSRTPVIFNGYSRDRTRSRYPQLLKGFDSGFRSFLAVPLVANDNVIGVLNLWSFGLKTYNNRHSELAERLGRNIASTLVNSRLFNEVKESEKQIEIHATKLERSNADLEQFAYVASHDLQSPLRSVAGLTKMIADDYEGKLDDGADELINLTISEVKKMQDLINNLLLYSRVGRDLAEPEPIDCEMVFEQEIDRLKSLIEDSNADITHDPLPTVMGEQSLIGQVFRNLIGNAIKYCDDKTPKVHVGVEMLGVECAITVSDNGIGIEHQYMERIFLMFQRLHQQDEYSGTGIGLAICKKAVERLGGRIWVDSVPGIGSKFSFTLSLVDTSNIKFEPSTMRT